MENAITVYETEQGKVELSPDIIKKYLVNGNGTVTDQEVTMFLNLCKYQKLNPFLREAYLIKFGSTPATMVTGKEVFTKRASKIKECKGWQAGIVVVKKDDEIERREGSLILKDESLVGGWCKVYRDGWEVPMLSEVSLKEYDKQQSSWKSMPAVMIRKVAIVTALRDTFPEDFQGLYSQEEMPVDVEKLDTKPVNINTTDYSVSSEITKDVCDTETKKESEQSETPKESTAVKLGNMLIYMACGDKDKAADMLEEYTKFTDKDGKEVRGRRTIQGMGEKYILSTYGKVKKDYEEWMNKPF